MRAILFSGQGSQRSHLGLELCQRDGRARRLYKTASEIAGFDVAALDDEALRSTQATQLAVVTYSLALWRLLPDREKEEVLLAGFSLGEYTALAAAGVLSDQDLLQLVLQRSGAMEKAVEQAGELGMAAVLGLDPQRVETLCREHRGRPVYTANFNSPTQTVVSGPSDQLKALKARFLEAGARRVIPVAVAGAFHSPYMEAAAVAVRAFAASLPFREPERPFYSNLDGRRLENNPDWPNYLAATMVAPVCFHRELENLYADGARDFVECGPGKTLQGFVRQTLTEVTVSSALDLIGEAG